VAWSAAPAAMTVEELLEHETTLGLHVLGGDKEGGIGAKLADASAAMAVLWLNRALKFVVRMFEILSKGEGFVGVTKAMRLAYGEVLKPYHSWLLRTTFDFFAKQVPGYVELMAILAPPGTPSSPPEQQAAVLSGMRQYVEAGYPVICLLDDMFAKLKLVDVRAS